MKFRGKLILLEYKKQFFIVINSSPPIAHAPSGSEDRFIMKRIRTAHLHAHSLLVQT